MASVVIPFNDYGLATVTSGKANSRFSSSWAGNLIKFQGAGRLVRIIDRSACRAARRKASGDLRPVGQWGRYIVRPMDSVSRSLGRIPGQYDGISREMLG